MHCARASPDAIRHAGRVVAAEFGIVRATVPFHGEHDALEPTKEGLRFSTVHLPTPRCVCVSVNLFSLARSLRLLRLCVLLLRDPLVQAYCMYALFSARSRRVGEALVSSGGVFRSPRASPRVPPALIPRYEPSHVRRRRLRCCGRRTLAMGAASSTDGRQLTFRLAHLGLLRVLACRGGIRVHDCDGQHGALACGARGC